MKTTKMSLANIQGKLSRSEMKNIMAGREIEPIGCGTGISCADKQEFEICGTKDCSCVTVPGGGSGYWCRSDG